MVTRLGRCTLFLTVLTISGSTFGFTFPGNVPNGLQVSGLATASATFATAATNAMDSGVLTSQLLVDLPINASVTGTPDALAQHETGFSGTVSASDAADVEAQYGNLSVTSTASASRTVLLLDGQTFADGAFQPNGSLPEMAYQDTLQITSATLPTGSPVLVRLAKTTVATVDGVGADMEFTSSFQATAITNGLSTVEPELLASGIVFQGSLSGFNTFVTPYNNVQSQTLSLHVGDTLQIGGYLDIWQGADAHSWISASGNASQTLEIDVLTPGASYSSASGTTYAIAAPEPATSSLLALAIPFLGRRRPRS